MYKKSITDTTTNPHGKTFNCFRRCGKYAPHWNTEICTATEKLIMTTCTEFTDQAVWCQWKALPYRPGRLLPTAGWLLEASCAAEDVGLADFLFMRALHSLPSISRRCAHFQLYTIVFICSSNMADNLTVIEYIWNKGTWAQFTCHVHSS
jgi:hypothetical protein